MPQGKVTLPHAATEGVLWILHKLPINHFKMCSYGHNDNSSFSKQNLKHDFALPNWTDMSIASDVNEMFSICYGNVSSCAHQHVPFISK